jgi:hypothetical protein
MVILDKHGVVESKAMIRTSTNPYGVFFENPQPGGRLSRANHAHGERCDQPDYVSCCSCNAREVREEIQGSSFSGKNRARGSLDNRKRIAGFGVLPVAESDFEFQSGIKAVKRAARHIDPRDAAPRSRDNQSSGSLFGGDNCIRCRVASPPEVF